MNSSTQSNMIKSFSYRIKDAKRSDTLEQMARSVNVVWNFCNETQLNARCWNKRWPNYATLCELTAGSRPGAGSALADGTSRLPGIRGTPSRGQKGETVLAGQAVFGLGAVQASRRQSQRRYGAPWRRDLPLLAVAAHRGPAQDRQLQPGCPGALVREFSV